MSVPFKIWQKFRFNTKILLIIVFLYNLNFLFSADYQAVIRPLGKVSGELVNFGPCLVGDSLELNFIIQNTGIKSFYISQGLPSFYLGLSPNDPTQLQWERFRRKSGNNEFLPGSTDTLKIMFYSGETLVSKTGWHEALLAIGFLENSSPQSNLVIKADTFFIRVKKTLNYISGFEDRINFDSVHINPNIIPKNYWNIKNVWTNNILIKKIEPILITQPVNFPEIIVQTLPEELIEVFPDSIISIETSYQPRNRGFDSLLLKLEYYPNKKEFPDSTAFAFTEVSGIGVEQQIEIAYSTHNWFKDTVDLGNIRLNEPVNVEISLLNSGNLPFGIKSQVLLNDFDNNINPSIKFIEKFLPDNSDLLPERQMHAKVEVVPDKIGYFAARLQIESNIMDRNIFGVQPDKQFVYVYLKGFVRSPKLTLQVNEIDLGNIAGSSECDIKKDTVITLFNTGNDILFTTINIEPEGLFFSSKDFLTLYPNSSDTVLISFESLGGNFDSYEALIKFETSPNPLLSDSIIIKAKSIPPIAATLSIPTDIKSKPGTFIEVPIILHNNSNIHPASFAKSFTTNVYYNRSMLEFAGLRTIGTASEGSLNYGDQVENALNPELSLELRTFSSAFFLSKDTLAFIKFKTYLGNSNITEISFIDPKFGDGYCSNIFSLITANGIYSTDSVCGLNFKLLQNVHGNFSLDIFSTSKTGNEIFEINVPYQTQVNLKIIDIFGQTVDEILNERMPAGCYNFEWNNSNIRSGVYFVSYTTPVINLVKPVYISK